METIIGLLIVLVPVILKVIAKRREKSASADEELSYPVESLAMPVAEEPVSEEEPVQEPSPEVKPASAITPVPGGVGSVTTSVLMKHVVEAAEKV
jgi:hypothetical protein